MVDNVDVCLFIRARPLNEDLVSIVVKAVLRTNSDYIADYLRYIHISPKDYEKILKEAMPVVFRGEFLWFSHKQFHFTVWIRPQEMKSTTGSGIPTIIKLGYIVISISACTFDEYSYRRIFEENEKLSKTEAEEEARKRCSQNVNALIEIIREIWNALDPEPIYGVGDIDIVLPSYEGSVIPEAEDILTLDVEPYINWINIYGPELVNKFGREKLLSIPAHRVEELNSGILFVESPLPSFYMRDYNRETCYKINSQLGWKTYYIDIPDVAGLKPTIWEIGTFEKRFQDITDLKNYLEIDINEFRNKVKEGRIFAVLPVSSHRPISHQIVEMEKWLKERSVKPKVVLERFR